MNETKFARFDFVLVYISITSGIIIIQILGRLMFIFVLKQKEPIRIPLKLQRRRKNSRLDKK